MKIDFTKTDGTYTLSDALILPDDVTYSDKEIEAMKQERFDNWISIITTSSVESADVTNG